MFPGGEVVEARGARWIVARDEPYDGCTVFTLEGVGTSGRRLKLIAPFDRVRRVQSRRLIARSRQHVLKDARAAIARARPFAGLWSAAEARITILPYQLEPALAVLCGATRVLLADEVGLGKTVQAGLILAELRARGFVNRAIVLTPPSLRHAWAGELRDRFGLAAAVLDQTAITSQSWLTAGDVNPWSCHDLVVASIDFVKRPDVLGSITAVHFDLLIADEAHHLTPGSDRGSAVHALAAQAGWVILASATPHSGDEAAFAFLQSIGAHNDRLAVFRRSRAGVGTVPTRRSALLVVRPTAAEAEMFAAVDTYADALWRARADNWPARLVAITLRRRAASSATALLRTLTRRRDLLTGRVESQPLQPALPWEETEDDGEVSDVVLGARGLDDETEERRCLDRLLELAEAATRSPSKIARLARLMRRIREPVLIFTEYRDTLDAVAAALEPSSRVTVLHGGLATDVRRGSIERFTCGDTEALVATDAAGEGLNLHRRCRVVINMELPWNPQRLEQRIGRVDRIGQTRRVHAVHLVHRDTVEDTVLARLERRRIRAATALDEVAGMWSSEADIASTVFGEPPNERRTVPRIASAHVSRAKAEALRVEAQRAWSVGRLVRSRPVWAPPRSSGRSVSVITLWGTRLAGSAGLTIEERVDAAVVDLARTPLDGRQWHDLLYSVERLLPTPPAANEPEPFRAAVLDRLCAIRSQLARSRRRPWQGSLFDHRAARDEERRAEALNAIDAHLARAIALVDQLRSGDEPPRRRLIAAWPSPATRP